MKLQGITMSQFLSASVQAAFKKSVAQTLGVPVDQIVIIAVAEVPARRLGGKHARRLASALAVQVGVKQSISTVRCVCCSAVNAATAFRQRELTP